VLVLVALLVHTLALAVGGLLFVAGLLSGTVGLSSSKAVFSWFGARERGLAMGIRQIAVPVGAGIASVALPRLGLRGGWELALGLIAVAQLAAALLFLATLRTAVGERAPVKTALARQFADVLGHRNLMIAGSASVLLVMAQYALLAYLILFLGQQGWPTLSASLALLLVQVGAVVGRMAWGAASDRLFGGARRPAIVRIVVLAAAALAGLSAVQSAWPHWAVLLLAAAVGATALSWNGLMVTLMAEIGGAARAGAAMGLNATAVFLGALIATPLFGAIVDASHSYRVAFLGLSGVTLCSLLPLAFVREAAPEQRTVTLVS
jgi:sugar phosphate permease